MSRSSRNKSGMLVAYSPSSRTRVIVDMGIHVPEKPRHTKLIGRSCIWNCELISWNASDGVVSGVLQWNSLWREECFSSGYRWHEYWLHWRKYWKVIPHVYGDLHRRLDVVNQARGDFKETFNMGKFADPEYQQNLPPILLKHWTEIKGFQQQCHTVTLKVLSLFGLQNIELILSYPTITLLNNILRLTTLWESYVIPPVQREMVFTRAILEQVLTQILEVSLYCALHLRWTWSFFSFQDSVGGLQVQSNNSWIDATPIPDTILYLSSSKLYLLTG